MFPVQCLLFPGLSNSLVCAASSIIPCTFLFVFAVVFVELHAHIHRDKYLFKTYARGLSLLRTVKILIYFTLLFIRPFLPFPRAHSSRYSSYFLLCADVALCSTFAFSSLSPPPPLYIVARIFGPWILSENFPPKERVLSQSSPT